MQTNVMSSGWKRLPVAVLHRDTSLWAGLLAQSREDKAEYKTQHREAGKTVYFPFPENLPAYKVIRREVHPPGAPSTVQSDSRLRQYIK